MSRIDAEALQRTEERLRGLFVRSLAGEADAYRTLLTELAAHLRGYFRRRLARLPDDVEDLVQETLLAIHNQRHTYDTAQPLTAWLHAIARYKFVDLLRRRAGRDAMTVPLDDEHEVLAVMHTDAADARLDLTKLLQRLPPRQRDPIVCTKLRGMSVEETARTTGMSVSAVKVAVHRGMKALAAMIGQKHAG